MEKGNAYYCYSFRLSIRLCYPLNGNDKFIRNANILKTGIQQTHTHTLKSANSWNTKSQIISAADNFRLLLMKLHPENACTVQQSVFIISWPVLCFSQALIQVPIYSMLRC